MPFEIEMLSREQADKVINMLEGQFGDVKALEAKPSSLSEDISAFANADGGDLYIGIDEVKVNGEKTRSWRGFADPEAANAHAAVFDDRFPAGTEFRYEFLGCDGLPGLVLHVTVNKTRGVALATN